MEQSPIRSAEETSSITERGQNASVPVQGTELVDELGPIPTFPPLALDPKTGRMLPISEEEKAARRDAVLRMLKGVRSQKAATECTELG